MRVEMLHDYERHPISRRQMPEQFHGGFESAGRTADTDNGTTKMLFLCRSCGAVARCVTRLIAAAGALSTRSPLGVLGFSRHEALCLIMTYALRRFKTRFSS